MSSTIIADVCSIEEIAEHPNADRLQLARVRQWWTAVKAGEFAVGDHVVYIPPDVVLPKELAERWKVAAYCSRLPLGSDGTRPPGLRTRAARLRGVPSFGFIRAAEDGMRLGDSVVDRYGLSKFVPPLPVSSGAAVASPPGFHRYTDVENFGNYPNVFTDGEPVVLDEKIHGTNCRLGLVTDGGEPTFIAGSNRQAVAEFTNGKQSLYWRPMDDAVRSLLQSLRDKSGEDVILFGEVFGPKIQDMAYGRNVPDFRAFDISVGGHYLDHAETRALLADHGVAATPVVYEGPFSASVVWEHADGATTLCEPDAAGRFKGREEVVVRPVEESVHAMLGRRILKAVSADYLSRKGKQTDNG